MAVVSGQKLYSWRNQAQEEAIIHNVPIKEVDWLLQEISNLDSLSLRLGSFQDRGEISLKISLPELARLWQSRLSEHLPVQYLLGVTPWRSFSLKVTPDVLIPRPETEYIIDLVVEKSLNTSLTQGNWVDLGTGSGAIALGLAEVLTNAQIYAVDYSQAALKIAQENADNLGFAHRIKFYQGDWWSPLDKLKGKISGMVSNPPYIPTKDISQLQTEVVKHEPHLALDGGKDGLDCIRYLVATAPEYLISGGIWLIEMMAGQGKPIAAMLISNGNYGNIEIITDFAGFDRYALAHRL